MLLVGKSSLWVGTGEGYVVLIDSATYQHLLTIRRHTSSVRALAWARVFGKVIGLIKFESWLCEFEI